MDSWGTWILLFALPSQIDSVGAPPSVTVKVKGVPTCTVRLGALVKLTGDGGSTVTMVVFVISGAMPLLAVMVMG